jgi:hypothetical protein
MLMKTKSEQICHKTFQFEKKPPLSIPQMAFGQSLVIPNNQERMNSMIE